MEKKHETQKKQTSNIVLVGASIGKLQDVGQTLAQLFGYGCLNFENWLEVTHKKDLADLFMDLGENGTFSSLVQAMEDIQKVHDHIVLLSIRVCRGEFFDRFIKSIGPVILLDFPVYTGNEHSLSVDEKGQTVFFSELPGYLNGFEEKKKQFSEIFGLSESICQNADFIVNDQYSTSEEIARGLKQLLVKKISSKLQKKW